MPYTIKKFNGQTLAVIQDGTVDTITTNLQLPGKNYAGYGSSLNQSLVYLLENFANSVEPSNKIAGQLWFDTSIKKIKVYNGIDFKALSSTEYGATPPTGQLIGDLWFNSTTSQLFVFDGAAHKLIGPSLTNPSAAQLINKKLLDDGGNLRTILQAVFADSTMAIFSKDEFTIDSAQTPVVGFTKVYKGITLPSRVAYPNVQFGGVAKTSESLLVGATEYPALNFVQNIGPSQIINTDFKLRVEPSVTPTGAFTSLRGLFLGASDNFYLGFNSGIGYISNLTGGGITLTVTENGALVRVLTVNSNTMVPNIDSSVSLGSPTFKWKNVYANNYFAVDDPNLAPNNSAFRGRVLGTSVTATEGFIGNLTGNIKGNVLKSNGDEVLITSSAVPVFNGRTNGSHYGNLVNVNAVVENQVAIDVSGAQTIFRGAFSGVSETATSIRIGSTNFPGFVGTQVSTGPNFASTVAVRDALGDVYARNFVGTSSVATAIQDQNGIARLASVGNAPYTVVIRDADGTINVGDISGTSGNANQLAGYGLSVPNAPSTIVARDTSGDIFVSVMHGIATQAKFADLAEKYLADADYEIGTVLMIGGEKEVTASKWGKRAIGAVSANPAYLMNTDLEGGTVVALKGRIPVKVIGSIKKGDELIASDNGCAVMSVPHASGVFAIALESNDNTGVKLVECLIL